MRILLRFNSLAGRTIREEDLGEGKIGR